MIAAGLEWLAAAETLAANLAMMPERSDRRWFRIGDGFLAVRSNNPAFLDRFGTLFGACAVEGPESGFPVVDGRVMADARLGGALVIADGAPAAGTAGLAEALFADDGVGSVGTAGDWVGLASRSNPVWRMAVRGAELVMPHDGPWPYVTGATLIHWAMCAQAGVLFVHAAAVELGGSGLLLVGPTGTGKTTLAVGLARRGAGFLSDEVGAIRFDGPGLLPVPRAAGMRPGPCAQEAAPMLDGSGFPVETFADGSSKTLVPADALGATQLGTAIPFAHVIVLDDRGTTPRLARVDAAPRNAQYLAPVKSTPFSEGSGFKVLRLIKLVSDVSWHRLRAGAPDETIALIEREFGRR